MARASSPSYVAEFPLDIGRDVAVRLDKAVRAHGNLYNACLGEARRRAQLMRCHPGYKLACLAAKKTPAQKKARGQAFALCRQRFGFSAYALQKFSQKTRDSCWLRDHMGSADSQKTSERAFAAVNDWVIGVRGKPRMKATRAFRSISGKSNASVIRLRQGSKGDWHVQALGLVLPVFVVSSPKDPWQTDALKCRAKYVRLVRKTLRRKVCWVAQVVLEGDPPVKARHVRTEGIVGIDLGPRTLAVVGPQNAGDAGAFKEQLCPGTERPRRAKRRLARALDRSRRATNPDNFDERGGAKRGCRWKRSAAYAAIRSKMIEAERVLVATRKTEQGTHINQVLSLGTTIRLEKLNYVAWQKMFGRSVSNHAPGRFVTTLARTAERAGGGVEMFSPWRTKLSQYDHKAKSYTRKLLSQRTHVFADGAVVDRDLYSAWLARFVEDDTLVTTQLDQSWAAAGPRLEGLAVMRVKTNQPMSGKGLPDPRRRRSASPQNRSPGQGSWPQGRGREGAARVRSPERLSHGAAQNLHPQRRSR